MTDQIFMLPDLGEGLADAEIIEWKVQVGDVVAIDQVVVEVETAKAAVEVPIPFEGTVIELHGGEGQTMPVGAPLITVSGAAIGAGGRPTPAAQEQYREEERAGSGNVLIGYGTSDESPRRRRRAQSVIAGPQRSVSNASIVPSTSKTRTAAVAAGPRVISPVVRNLARQYELDLAMVPGTGNGGVITRADVERAAAAPGQERGGEGVLRAGPDVQRIPIKGLRKVVADKMSTSRREIPDATTWVDVDATAMLAARRAINALLRDEEKVSLMALMIRLALTALQHYPELNSAVDTDRHEIIRYGHVNLGIATHTPRGLIVPVLERADTLTMVEVAQQLQETTVLARDGKLPRARLSGGTFTFNNYGVFGVDGSTPIINHPEAAILGVGRIADKAWVVDGQLCVRKVTQLSLSFDHRVCDGGTAGGFLRLFGDYVENPVAALGRI